MEKMFEFALRNKVRFPYKGMLSVEDLYDLNVKELDSVFKTLNAQVKKSQEESLLATKTTEDEILSVQIAIVKHIFNIKVAEAEAIKQSKELKERKQMILGLIAEKENQELKNKSTEELKAMLDSLN